MDHARLIAALALESYADRTASKAILPDLIRKLIVASCQDLARCDIQDADHINRPGFDALIETTRGRQRFVPAGRSYWEVSNQDNSREKALADLEKRAQQVPTAERARCTFVFATLREWGPTECREWVDQHSDKGWDRLLVLDSSQFSDWLREVPPVARWLQANIDPTKSPSGWRDAAEHWDRLCVDRHPGHPPVPAGFFVASRDEAMEKVKALFEGDDNIVYLGAETNADVRDFVAAVVASQPDAVKANWAGRCVFIESRDAWSAIAVLPPRLILVGDSSLGLEADGDHLRREATQSGHAVIVPVRPGTQGSSRFCELVTPSAGDVEKELLRAGYSREQVQAILLDGFTCMSVLKHKLADRLVVPTYAGAPSRRWIALAGLVGAWQETFGQDSDAVATVLGISVEEWKGKVLADLAGPGAPIVSQDGHWRIVARREAWQALGDALFDDDLRRFEVAAIRVLGEADPTLDVGKEERWMASTVLGKRRAYSESLRKGMVETVALLGSAPDAVRARTSVGMAQRVADSVVRQLLRGANATRWLSLHGLLPELAEASPEEFLVAVEHAVAEPGASPFAEVFAQEGSGPMGGTYMSGLLWGLESLAWHPSYLPRVVLALAALAAIDPGGKWANRPSHSLTTLLLPWLPQTTAPVSLREAAVRAMAKEQPAVAWKVVLSLLPDTFSSSSGCRKPEWRTDLMAGWNRGVSHEEYVQQVEAYCKIAIELAAGDVGRLGEMAQVVHRLHPDARNVLLDQLVPALVAKPEAEVLVVWEALVALAARHRAFHDAKWAMPSEEVEKVERAAASIEPRDPALRHRRLFGERGLFASEKLGWQEQERRLAEQRAAALREILRDAGIAPVMPMIDSVKEPSQLGVALGNLDRPDDDAQILPRMLSEERPSARSFVAGFVWGRWQKGGWAWVDALDKSDWPVKSVATFFTLLPFTSELWLRADGCGEQVAAAFWASVAPHPWGVDDAVGAAARLLARGRPRVALSICGAAVLAQRAMTAHLAVRVLRACMAKTESKDHVDTEAAMGLIKWLQEQDGVDQAALFEVEWGYLGLLDHMHGPGPKTIEARLATDPNLFCEAVGLVFRSEKEPKDETKVVSEKDRQLADAAYRLLHGMEALPGRLSNGTFDGGVFTAWLAEVRRLAEESGHLQGALIQVGQVLARAAGADDWFVSMPELAEALNAKDAEKMRREFRTQLYNSRGVFSPSGGKQERALATRFEQQAAGLETRGWIRVATALRDLARGYTHEAEQAAREDGGNG